jgi:hypothetical protein
MPVSAGNPLITNGVAARAVDTPNSRRSSRAILKFFTLWWRRYALSADVK